LQALIVEFAGEFASTVGLDWKMWLVSIFLGFFRFAYYPTYYFSIYTMVIAKSWKFTDC
jgi:hypothetical protein